jgi:hypothetical protein
MYLGPKLPPGSRNWWLIPLIGLWRKLSVVNTTIMAIFIKYSCGFLEEI